MVRKLMSEVDEIHVAGVFLPKLCEVQGVNARRGMAELKSSGIVAPGPVHSLQFGNIEPAVSPSPN